MNQNPEQLASVRIDQQLTAAGWVIQNKKTINLAAATGVAIFEYSTEVGPADYILFVARKPVGVIEAHVFRARPLSQDYNSKYIAFYSQTKAAKSYFFKHGKQTTNLASINLTVLSNLPITIPSFEEQKQIVQEIESRFSVCDKIEETITASLKQTEVLPQSILKKAFKGKLL